MHAEVGLDPHLVECAQRAVAELAVERLQNPLSTVQEQHPRLTRVDRPELVCQCARGQFADLPGELDTGGPAARNSKGQPGFAFFRCGQRFGHLEGGHQLSADGQRVVEGLHARRPLDVLLVTVVRLLHSCSHHEVVVLQLEGRSVEAARCEHSRLGVDGVRLTERDVRVVLVAQQVPQRTCDGAFRQQAGGALVQQRLEHVAGAALDNGHRDIGALEALCRVETSESSTHDQHMGPAGCSHSVSTPFAARRRSDTRLFTTRIMLCGSGHDRA